MQDAQAQDAALPETRCPVCAAPAPGRLRAREMMFGTRQPFTYGECPACGLLWLLDVPADLSVHYPADYYAFAPVEPRVPTGLRAWMRRAKLAHVLGHATPVGAALERLRPSPALSEALGWIRTAGARLDSRILDVGCGQGRIVNELGDAGFTDVTGVDPFIAGDIDYPNGVRVRKRALGDVTGLFDLVMCHHAFEHMDAPLDRLREMARVLAPGGTVLIRIPLGDSLACETYGTDWVQLDAPRHLYLHTRRSMAHLEREAGLREAAVVYDSSGFGFWGSELYRRDLPLQAPDGQMGCPERLGASVAEMEAFEQSATQANDAHRGDQAAFYLRHA